VLDVTRRRLDEERIRQQASLLDKTQDAILVCDLSYRILYWNKGAELLYGWQTDDVLGKDFCDVLCSGDDTQLRAAQKTLAKNDEFKTEAVQTTRTDKNVIVESRWNLVRNERHQPDYFLIINTDITEQKKSEEQLCARRLCRTSGRDCARFNRYDDAHYGRRGDDSRTENTQSRIENHRGKRFDD